MLQEWGVFCPTNFFYFGPLFSFFFGDKRDEVFTNLTKPNQMCCLTELAENLGPRRCTISCIPRWLVNSGSSGRLWWWIYWYYVWYIYLFDFDEKELWSLGVFAVNIVIFLSIWFLLLKRSEASFILWAVFKNTDKVNAKIKTPSMIIDVFAAIAWIEKRLSNNNLTFSKSVISNDLI